jgi:hypothetical protein
MRKTDLAASKIARSALAFSLPHQSSVALMFGGAVFGGRSLSLSAGFGFALRRAALIPVRRRARCTSGSTHEDFAAKCEDHAATQIMQLNGFRFSPQPSVAKPRPAFASPQRA